MKAKIDATASNPASGDYIRVATYDWRESGYGAEVADSLVRAANNGVSVRIVVGTGQRIDASILTRFRGAGSDLVQCEKACMPEPSGAFRRAMHNKFIAITEGDTKLVLQTSTNLDANQAKHAQNMLIVRDDSKLFSAYVTYWRPGTPPPPTAEPTRSRYAAPDTPLSRMITPAGVFDYDARLLDAIADLRREDSSSSGISTARSPGSSRQRISCRSTTKLPGRSC